MRAGFTRQGLGHADDRSLGCAVVNQSVAAGLPELRRHIGDDAMTLGEHEAQQRKAAKVSATHLQRENAIEIGRCQLDERNLVRKAGVVDPQPAGPERLLGTPNQCHDIGLRRHVADDSDRRPATGPGGRGHLCSAFGVQVVDATESPSPASRGAVARPKPAPAPVMIATRPRSSLLLDGHARDMNANSMADSTPGKTNGKLTLRKMRSGDSSSDQAASSTVLSTR